MTTRRKRNAVQTSRPAANYLFDGLTALTLLSCLVTLGCDTSPRDERVPADDVDQGNPADQELGANLESVESQGSSSAQSSAAAQGSGSGAAQGSGAGSAQGALAGQADDGASTGLSRTQLAEGAIEAPQVLARASLEPTQGQTVRGSVEFVEASHGIEIMVSALDLEPGTHGIHLHESGDCSAPDASSAGDHFSPEGDPHGAPRDMPEAHHAGDLGNITADESGNAEKQINDPELQIEGEYGVVGRAIIIHQGEDDLTSQPSGDSGDPVACGVIERVDASTTDRV